MKKNMLALFLSCILATGLSAPALADTITYPVPGLAAAAAGLLSPGSDDTARTKTVANLLKSYSALLTQSGRAGELSLLARSNYGMISLNGDVVDLYLLRLDGQYLHLVLYPTLNLLADAGIETTVDGYKTYTSLSMASVWELLDKLL